MRLKKLVMATIVTLGCCLFGGAFAACEDLPIVGKYFGGEIEYEIMWEDEAVAVRYKGDAKHVRIADTYKGVPVTTIGVGLFAYCDDLKSVEIPDSVNVIWDYAFGGCSGLTGIDLPDDLYRIGEGVFSGCSSLKSIDLPDGLDWIGPYAFSNCESLTSIVIPDGVTSIGDYAFYNCTSLTSVVIGDSVTSIGEWAFANCTSLTSVVIGDSVTSIGYRAFYSCDSLTSITFKGTVAEWNAISKGTDWRENVPATEVVCSDGKVAI